MHFHSLDYLVFLVTVVFGYWLLVRHNVLRLAFVFVASCLFYMAWNPAYIVLILTSTVLDYFVGLGIHEATAQRTKRRWLLASLLGNLGLLGIFKYYNFFATATADGLGALGVPVEAATLDVLLPVGISFYTFQTLSYTIDVYRGRMEPTRNFFRFAFFVTFFPQLVAGPIVRASELIPQLGRMPVVSRSSVGSGFFLIATGMVKKVVIADYLAVNFVDRVFDEPAAYTSAEVMIALYGYTMQIYCDFSGYTDVARGSAMMFGLKLPENFDRPYQATSPAEFWRRWHMTLSSWLRDYLYFPLGGSRVPEARAYFNLGLTMFLIGFWHGAAWTFVIYGLIQSAAMLIHRFAHRRSGRRRDAVDPVWLMVLKVVGTLHFAVLSRIFFRAPDVETAFAVGGRLALDGSWGLGHVPWQCWALLLFGYGAHYTPRRWFEQIERRFVALPALLQGAALALVGSVVSVMASTDVVPYIYFQF